MPRPLQVMTCKPSRSEDMVMALSGLVTVTFDLSTSEFGQGSPVSWASFLLGPFHSRLIGSDIDIDIDGRTDEGRQRLG